MSKVLFFQELLRPFVFDDNNLDRLADALANGGGRRGVLVSGFCGSGKTSLLQSILNRGELTCTILDCGRYPTISSQDLVTCLNPPTKVDFVLLDNLDKLIGLTCVGPKHHQECMLSVLLHVLQTQCAIENKSRRHFIVATLTERSMFTASPAGNALCQPHLFGEATTLTLPNHRQRFEWFGVWLSVLLDTLMETAKEPEMAINEFCTELSDLTVGFSAGDVQKAIRYFMLHCQRDIDESPETLMRGLRQVMATIQPTATNQNPDESGASKLSHPSPLPDAVISHCRRSFDFSLLPSHARQSIDLVINRFSSRNIRRCYGALIHGSSGSGKTAVAAYLSEECRRRTRCRVISVQCADLVSKEVGASEKYLARLFSTARTMSPCVIVLDGLDDVIGVEQCSRGSTNAGRRTAHKATDRLLSTLLLELDGLLEPSPIHIEGKTAELASGSILVVVTAKRKTSLDRALLRPGRLEEHVQLEPPNVEQRREFTRLLLFRLCGGQLDERQPWLEQMGIDGAIDSLVAEHTSNRLYGDLRLLFDEASISVLQQHLTGKRTDAAVDGNNVHRAMLLPQICRVVAERVQSSGTQYM